jgi:hypothetical protein
MAQLRCLERRDWNVDNDELGATVATLRMRLERGDFDHMPAEVVHPGAAALGTAAAVVRITLTDWDDCRALARRGLDPWEAAYMRNLSGDIEALEAAISGSGHSRTDIH